MKDKATATGKPMATLAYITVFGLVIAYFSIKSNPNAFTSYHVRQSLGLYALWAVVILITWLLTIAWLSLILHAGIVVLLLLGLIAAAEGEEKPVPIFGSYFQRMFNSI